jgi:hypothetical protein
VVNIKVVKVEKAASATGDGDSDGPLGDMFKVFSEMPQALRAAEPGAGSGVIISQEVTF